MFKALFGTNEYKINPVNEAMSIYENVYLNEIRAGYNSELAITAAETAAEAYMTQYMSFKERGL